MFSNSNSFGGNSAQVGQPPILPQPIGRPGYRPHPLR